MTTEQRINFVTSRLNKTIGGSNVLMAKTDLGAKQQALNNIGDTMENIGTRLLPLQGAFFRTVNKHLPEVEKLVDKTFSAIEFAIKATMPAWQKLGKTVRFIGEKFKEFNINGETLKDLFTNIVVPALNLAVDATDKFARAIFGLCDIIRNNRATIETFLWLFGSSALINGITGLGTAIKALNIANFLGKLASSKIIWNGLIGTWANIEFIWRTGFVPAFRYIGTYMLPAVKLLGSTIMQTISTKIIPAFMSLGATVLRASLPLLPWIAGITVIAGLAFVVWKNWDWLKEKFVQAIAWACENLTKFKNFAITIFQTIGEWFKTHIIDVFTIALGPIGLVARGLYEIGKRLNLIDGAKVATTSNVNVSAKTPEPPMAKTVGSQGNITIGFDKDSQNALDGATPFVSSIKAKNMNLSPA